MSHLPDLLEANRRYQTTGFHAAPRTPQPQRHLVILTCMDARLDVFACLGLELGDAHILRNAGGRVTEDSIRSLVVSSYALGTREVGIIHHTNCGLEATTQENMAERTGTNAIDYLAFADVEESVRDDVNAVRVCQYLPSDFVSWGAVYDVDNGELRTIVPPQ